MVSFEFDSMGNIYRILPAYNAFQDPGIPIPKNITKLTGITDDMVKDQAIDLGEVAALLSTCSIVIAHNAKFDRPFVENFFDGFKEMPWGCSFADVVCRKYYLKTCANFSFSVADVNGFPM